MKRTVLPAALLVVAGLLAACGNDSSSAAAGDGSSTSTSAASSDSSSDAGSSVGGPTDASVQDFCQTFVTLARDAQAHPTKTDAEAVQAAKKSAAELARVGTPADMPADARRAFEAAISTIDALPADATKAEVNKAASDLSKAEQADQQALSDYITTKCTAAFEASPSASPSS